VCVYYYERPSEVITVKKHQTYGDLLAFPRTFHCPRKDDLTSGSVTLVLLPLKYEIDDSVTVTVVLLGEAGRCTLMGGR